MPARWLACTIRLQKKSHLIPGEFSMASDGITYFTFLLPGIFYAIPGRDLVTLEIPAHLAYFRSSLPDKLPSPGPT